MSRHRLVRRTTRGGELDRRDINAVILEAAATEHGLRQLGQIVTDGRTEIPPRRVSRDGKPVRAAGHDGDVVFDEAWLRSNWGGESEAEEPDESESGVETPEVQLMRRRERVKDAVATLVSEVGRLRKPEDASGAALIDTVGLPAEFVDELLASLTSVQRTLLKYEP